MKFIADLHIHSRYSRACSKELTPDNLWKWGQLKGIRVIGTGDFTHPAWIAELQERLEENDGNLLNLKAKAGRQAIADIPASCRSDVSFLLTAEISCIYKKGGKTRKVHALVFMPDFASALRLNMELAKIGNIKSDGRPILGLDAKRLLEIVLEISPAAMLIPAHAWTPHFSVFGAASGFDSLEECFEELTPHIYAIETGLSSDPPMNRRLSALDNITLVSNSDAHSPAKIGREANIFDAELSYEGITSAIKSRKGFVGTVEFFPEEGKYHSDGHRDCGVRLSPVETMRNSGLCPACGKKVTIGVLHRVELLADRGEGTVTEEGPIFYSVIPLAEVLGEVFSCGVNTQKVNRAYFQLLELLGNEFNILLNAPLEDIAAASSPRIAEAIGRVRSANLHIEPGYDGEFGKIRIFD